MHVPFPGAFRENSRHAHESRAGDTIVNRLRTTIHRPVDRFSAARHRTRSLRVQDMDEVSSIDLDSALTEDSTAAGPVTGGAAAGSDSEARLRRGLHRATATNARLSAVVLVLATIYVGWLAERFAASRALAVALIAVGLTTAA
jgi:hypothetical protein